jgi:hypothetical protein
MLAPVDRGTKQAKSIIVDDLSFASHDFVRHGQGEYGSSDVHTDTVEGSYSISKRGMKGM